MESATQKRNPRAPMRQTTLNVMRILKFETEKNKPITISDLVKKLENDDHILVTRDSVKRILNDLMEFMPGPDKICCSEREKGDGSEYTSRYYYQLYQTDPKGDISSAIQKVIQDNNLAGDKITTLSFWLNGYGSNHKLYHVGKQYSGVEPQKIITANGHDYLVCLLRNRDRLFHLRLDLITDLKTHSSRKTDRKQLENISKSSDYQANHPGMFYDRAGENPDHIHLKIRKNPKEPNASLTFLQDTFGDDWKLSKPETAEEAEIVIFATPSVAAQFVWQYWNRVTVTGPDNARIAIEEELERRYKTLSEGFKK